MDERLLRDELRRAAGEKRGEVRVAEGVVTDANHGVKQLLRACLESEEMAEALLPEIVESGAVGGLLGENIFKQLWEARQRDEKLNLADAEALTPQEKRLAADALFWQGSPPGLEQAQGCLRALKFQRLQSGRDKLQREIEAAAQSPDPLRLAELQRDKSDCAGVEKRLAALKKSARGQTNWVILHLILRSRRRLTACQILLQGCQWVAPPRPCAACCPFPFLCEMIVCCPWGGHRFGV